MPNKDDQLTRQAKGMKAVGGLTMSEAIKFARASHYRNILKTLDDLILGTPSGPIRNRLTEANIALMRCQADQASADRGEKIIDSGEPTSNYTNQD